MKTLPELIIDGFDAEQVWAGIDLQNKVKFDKFADTVTRLNKLVDLESISQVENDKNKRNIRKDIKLKPFGSIFNLLTGGDQKYGPIKHSENILESSDEEDGDDLRELKLEELSEGGTPNAGKHSLLSVVWYYYTRVQPLPLY